MEKYQKRVQQKIDLPPDGYNTYHTMGSVNFRAFKQYNLPRETLFVVQDPYGTHQAVSSYAEREYFYCLDRLRGEHQGRIGSLRYSPSTCVIGFSDCGWLLQGNRTVFQFDGCFWHLHLGCTLCPSGK